MTDPQIIIALDFSDQDQVEKFVSKLDPKLCRLKVGLELFTNLGPIIVEKLQKSGFEIFLDLKFHDIPNTVSQAVKAAASQVFGC